MSGDVPVVNSDANELTVSLFNPPDFTEHLLCCRPLGSRVKGHRPSSERFHSISGEDKGVRSRQWDTQGGSLLQCGEGNRGGGERAVVREVC